MSINKSCVIVIACIACISIVVGIEGLSIVVQKDAALTTAMTTVEQLTTLNEKNLEIIASLEERILLMSNILQRFEDTNVPCNNCSQHLLDAKAYRETIDCYKAEKTVLEAHIMKMSSGFHIREMELLEEIERLKGRIQSGVQPPSTNDG